MRRQERSRRGREEGSCRIPPVALTGSCPGRDDSRGDGSRTEQHRPWLWAPGKMQPGLCICFPFMKPPQKPLWKERWVRHKAQACPPPWESPLLGHQHRLPASTSCPRQGRGASSSRPGARTASTRGVGAEPAPRFCLSRTCSTPGKDPFFGGGSAGFARKETDSHRGEQALRQDTRAAKGEGEPWQVLGFEMATMNQRIRANRLGDGCGCTLMPGQTILAAAF